MSVLPVTQRMRLRVAQRFIKPAGRRASFGERGSDNAEVSGSNPGMTYIFATAPRWCNRPVQLSPFGWREGGFDSRYVGFIFVVADFHRGKRENGSKQSSRVTLFGVS